MNEPKGETFKDQQDYEDTIKTRSELAELWANKLAAADRVFTVWSNRFKVSALYQYYEGFQHMGDFDENNRPYVVNLIYSTIEQKLPSMIFDNPSFTLRPHPYGETYDFDTAVKTTQLKEDTLNFIASRREFGLLDKHELAILDAFFGFGVIETDYSGERSTNPELNTRGNSPLDKFYCKHIPFDTFRVSAAANWDLSVGKWFGYYEFVPMERLKKYIDEGKIIEPKQYGVEDSDFATLPSMDGKIVIGDNSQDIAPYGTIKIWYLWDFEHAKKITLCPDHANNGDRLLDYESFKNCPISVLRYGKRRKGWYPLPPVFNWLSPQDEINDIRQAAKIHRKRFSRKYAILEGSMDPEEEDKFLYGPDGTAFKVNNQNAIKAVEDAPLDNANPQSLISSYEDMNRVSGTSDEQRGIADRQTATQSNIINSRSQIRESKDVARVGNFLVDVAHNILRAVGKAGSSFWISTKLPEGLLGELKNNNTRWTKVPSSLFKTEDYDVDLQVSSISPVYQQEDKKTFMEFLAVLTQYPILSMSPALLREAAYRIGYKNSSVLNQFQQLAQLAAIGREMQAKAALQPVPQGQQPTQEGQLPQQQVAHSTPPDSEQIMNTIFNRAGVQK